MTCTCAFDKFLTALKGALCMPEFPVPGASYTFGSLVEGIASSKADGPTTDAAANTKGAWTELIASTPFASGFAIVQIQSAIANACLVDIGIGGSGSEQVIIPDLQIDQRFAIPRSYEFPIYIPQGVRVAARAQDASTFDLVVPIKLTLFASSLTAPGPCMVSAYGATASSKGTDVDPGGTAHTKSGWVEIASSTNRQHNWLCLSAIVGDDAATLSSYWLLDVGIGGSGSEQVIVPDVVIGMNSAQDQETAIFNLPLSVPSGSRLSVRAQSTNTTAGDRDLYVKIYGC